MRVNPAVLRTAPPPIPLAQGWKAQYLAASSPSGPMLDLSQGVPSAPPSQSFVESLIDVVKDPSSARYGGILGEPVLRRALRDEWEDVYDPLGRWEGKLDGQGVTADNLGVVCGANMVRRLSLSLSVLSLAALSTAAVLEMDVPLTRISSPPPSDRKNRPSCPSSKRSVNQETPSSSLRRTTSTKP